MPTEYLPFGRFVVPALALNGDVRNGLGLKIPLPSSSTNLHIVTYMDTMMNEVVTLSMQRYEKGNVLSKWS